MRRLLARALLVMALESLPLAAGAAGGLPAQVVQSCTDSAVTTPGGAPGELRRLIKDATPHALIVIPAGCVITLAGAAGDDASLSGDLDILVSLTIQGAGPGQSIIDGGAVDRVLHLVGAVTVAVSGVTIRNGDVTGRGGGVLVTAGATLALHNVEVTGSVARTADPAQEGGGGVANQGGTVTLSSVTLHDNATQGTGGGLRNAGEGTASLENVTVSGNRADSSGGGVAAVSGRMSLNNVTIVLNDADHDASSSGTGGGLRVVDNASTDVVMRNTLLTRNTRFDRIPDDCSVGPLTVGQFTSHGSNLVQSPTGCPGLVPLDGPPGAETGDVTEGRGPDLGPLALNGGLTRTHALQAGSAGLDRGDAGCAATDQRGVNRPQNGRCDIGAFERGTPGVASLALADFDGDGRADLVVARGGPGGEVRVLSGATGDPVLAVAPFGPGYRGALAVSSCDLTGDGMPDLVVGGVAGGPVIRVLDGSTGQPVPGPLESLLPFAGLLSAGRPGLRGPVTVGCADVNGDGTPDVIAGAPEGAPEGPLVRVFSGLDGGILREALPFGVDVQGVVVGP